MFSKTEMSEVLTEVCKMDPDFEPDKFVRWCQYDVIPNLLEVLYKVVIQNPSKCFYDSEGFGWVSFQHVVFV